MALISKSEWARKHGFSKSYVSKLINSGDIVVEPNGQLDEATANSRLQNKRDVNRPLMRNGARQNEIYDLLAKTKLKNEIAKGKLLEARVKAEIGELISVDSVKNAMFAKGRLIRDSLLNLPNRVSQLLANETDPTRIHDLLMDEIREILKDLAGDEKI